MLTIIKNAKLLGLKIDKELSFSEHVNAVCKKVSQCICLLRKIKSYLPLKQQLLYYNAMIKPLINYASVIWTNSDKEGLGRILKLQKRAARVILNVHRQAPSVPLFNRLKWLPFYKDALISKCGIAYKSLRGEVPSYISNRLKLNSYVHTRQTRYTNFNLISPRFNRQTEGGRTFTTTTCKVWNSLSLSLRQRDSVKSFKSSFWNELFRQQQTLNHFII